LKLEGFVGSLPTEYFYMIENLLGYEPLRRLAEQRAHRASRQDVNNLLLFELPPIIADRCIAIYVASTSFAEANDWSSQMCLYANDFSVDQQRRVLEGISENGQLRHSNTVGSVISKLRQTKKFSPGEFENLLDQNGLQLFMLEPGEPEF
jgi:hypothetical protein